MAAKYAVTGDQYRTIDRRIRAIKEQLDQKGGSPLDPEGVATALQLILEGDIPRPVFKRDMRKEAGWTLEKEGPEHPCGVTEIRDLELVSFLNYDEQSISGTEFEERAGKLGIDLGQKVAEWLLDHQGEIPEEWRSYYLVFPGTVWRSSNGSRSVPSLGYNGSCWYLGFHWFDCWFSFRVRLVRARSPR